jgi:ParB-like chromosome segregation protein Spo0J
MTSVDVADIVAAIAGDQGRRLDPEQVERYRRSIDRLPPVVVFDTEDGLLLADGHHRLAAAAAEGRETIEADVRIGSRSDALAFAVAAGAAQTGLPPEDVNRHIPKRYDR